MSRLVWIDGNQRDLLAVLAIEYDKDAEKFAGEAERYEANPTHRDRPGHIDNAERARRERGSEHTKRLRATKLQRIVDAFDAARPGEVGSL